MTRSVTRFSAVWRHARRCPFLCAGLLLLTILPGLWAQGEAVSARLVGTVLDPAEAPVPQAKVTLTGTDTGFTRQFLTSQGGSYVFPLIPPGRYQLAVEKSGFSTYSQSGMILTVGQSTTLDVRLELGPVTQIIEVSTDAPLLNSGNANIGLEVSGKQAVELPLNIRNPYNLVLLSSGANNNTQYQGLT
jgi:hypothetical protein